MQFSFNSCDAIFFCGHTHTQCVVFWLLPLVTCHFSLFLWDSLLIPVFYFNLMLSFVRCFCITFIVITERVYVVSDWHCIHTQFTTFIRKRNRKKWPKKTKNNKQCVAGYCKPVSNNKREKIWHGDKEMSYNGFFFGDVHLKKWIFFFFHDTVEN